MIERFFHVTVTASMLLLLYGVKCMEIYSLSGPSGTGKSTSALQFAFTHQIEAIIDDGLFIVNGTKVAGTSAKFEKNTMTAVKRAIFTEDAHCEEVKAAIQQYGIQTLLIIGTSEKMTRHIAKRLEIGDIQHFCTIEDIRSEREIKMAQFVRSTQGKHVMPIPYKQVEQNFFKRLVQRGMEIFSSKKEKIGETTIVFPDFHQETIQISRHVYVKIIKHIILQNAEVYKLEGLEFSMGGKLPLIVADIILKGPITYTVQDKMQALQRQIDEAFLLHFGIQTGTIHLKVKAVYIEK